MVQHQRSAGEQPGQDRAGEARERRAGERTEQHRVGLDARFEMHRKARGGEFGMAARDRHDAVRRDVEGDAARRDRKVRPGVRSPAARHRSRRYRRAARRRPGRFSPKPQRKRIVKVSAAICIARSPCTTSPMRWQPISARAATRLSAAAASAWRHSSGKGAAISPARITASSAITLSTVLGSWIATTASVGRPKSRSRAASAEMARSACA